MLFTTYISNIKNIPEEYHKNVIIIARYFKSDKFKKDTRLSPPDWLLKAYKSHDIDWEKFEYEFKKYMLKGETLTAMRQLYAAVKSGKDIILACYEKDDSVCHRRLIREYLSQWIKTKEYEIGDL